MTSPHRVLVLAGACGALALAAAPPHPAEAQSACKGEAIIVSGTAKFRPLSKTKELEGRGAAMADAIAKWERQAASKYGQAWKAWSKARDAKFDCAPTNDGKVTGTSFIGCTISGRPCSAGVAPTKAGRAERGKGGPDTGDSARDNSQPGPEFRAGSPEYDREMAAQEKLAEQRRKEEAEAYEREMALQERLANERWKGDQRGDGPPPGRRR